MRRGGGKELNESKMGYSANRAVERRFDVMTEGNPMT
jgi:hypothetical protein